MFDLDVLACPRCGGRLRVIATVQNPAVVRTILAHVGRALREPLRWLREHELRAVTLRSD